MKDAIILASGSPRRRELLEQIGIPYRTLKCSSPEFTTSTDPVGIVKELSARKAQAAAEKESGIILGADTIVWQDGRVLGKPSDRSDARRMLECLSGREHSVYTGVTLIRMGEDRTELNRLFLYRETKVRVFRMTQEEIEAYLDTGEPFDKAGAYGIQGSFAAFIDSIEGDYTNVVGLPVGAVYQALKQI